MIKGTVQGLSDVTVWILTGLIWLYRQLISPLIGPRCRYQPTCSAYAIEALKKRGPVVGLWLAVRRISRCHPWGGHGYDPVPEKKAGAKGS